MTAQATDRPEIQSRDSELAGLLALVAQGADADAIRIGVDAVESRLIESTKLADKARRLISEARSLNSTVADLVEYDNEEEKEEDAAVRAELDEWLDQTEAFVDGTFPKGE